MGQRKGKTAKSGQKEARRSAPRQPAPQPAAAAATPADYLLYLQRTIGNQATGHALDGTPPDGERPGDRPVATPWRWSGGAVQRLATVTGRGAGGVIQRHTSIPLRYEENSIQAKRLPGPQIQRHTSIPLRYEENSIQALRADGFLQRDLIDDMNDALDGWGGDVERMRTAISNASDPERRAALADPRLMRRLQSELDRSDALTVLNDLGAPLSQRLEAAMSGWGADATAIVTMIEQLPPARAAEKDAVLRNPRLMARLRDELSREQAVRAMRGLGAPLAEQLYAAMEGWGADVQLIIDITTNVSPEQKRAAARDRALIDRLRAEIPEPAQMYQVLRNIGVSLVDRINIALDGWGFDRDNLLAITRQATPTEQEATLRDAATLARLRDELSREDMLTVLGDLNASLTDRLNAAMDGWGVDGHAVLTMIPNASEAHRLAAYADTALMERLRSELSEADFEQARLLLRFGSQEAIDAATDEERAATTTVENLTHLISTELDQAEPDTAKILTDIRAASAEDKELVRSNHALIGRLAAALSAADMQEAQAALGEGLINRLNTLIDQAAPVADFLVLINAADEEAKHLVLTNRLLLDRLRDYFDDADEQNVLAALGDTLAARLEQARRNGAAVDAILSLIEGAEAAQRTATEIEAMLFTRLEETYGSVALWRFRLHLRHGSAANYPNGVPTLLETLGTTPNYADIRRTLANMMQTDFDGVRQAVGVRDVLRSLVSGDEFVFLLRMLDQGLISEEGIQWDWSETLMNDDPDEAGNIFEPMVYEGTGAFDVAYHRDRFQIDVRIKMNAGDSGAESKLNEYKTRLEPQIEGVWDSQYNLRNVNGTLPIRVNCNFTSSNPHHTIKVYAQVAGVNYGMYNLSNWYPDANGFPVLAPSHEFGHMLGNRDEYNLGADEYQATVGTDPATDVNATPETDDTGAVRYDNSSVMGSNTTGRVDPRHLNYFVNWINDNRRRDAQGNFIEPAFTLVP